MKFIIIILTLLFTTNLFADELKAKEVANLLMEASSKNIICENGFDKTIKLIELKQTHFIFINGALTENKNILSCPENTFFFKDFCVEFLCSKIENNEKN